MEPIFHEGGQGFMLRATFLALFGILRDGLEAWVKYDAIATMHFFILRSEIRKIIRWLSLPVISIAYFSLVPKMESSGLLLLVAAFSYDYPRHVTYRMNLKNYCPLFSFCAVTNRFTPPPNNTDIRFL